MKRNIEGFHSRVGYISELIGNPAKLAKKAGLTPKSIWGYMNEGREPTLSKLIALADAAEVNLLWLATGKGPIKPEKELKNKDFVSRLVELQNDFPEMEITAKVKSQEKKQA